MTQAYQAKHLFVVFRLKTGVAANPGLTGTIFNPELFPGTEVLRQIWKKSVLKRNEKMGVKSKIEKRVLETQMRITYIRSLCESEREREWGCVWESERDREKDLLTDETKESTITSPGDCIFKVGLQCDSLDWNLTTCCQMLTDVFDQTCHFCFADAPI